MSEINKEQATKEMRYSWDKNNTYDMMEWAWGIIANAHGGNWDEASDEWREAAETWRDYYAESWMTPTIIKGVEDVL